MTDMKWIFAATAATLTALITAHAAAGNAISSAPFDICDAQASRKCGRFSDLTRQFWKCYDPDFDACMESFRPKAAVRAPTAACLLQAQPPGGGQPRNSVTTCLARMAVMTPRNLPIPAPPAK
ncbi:hypothetical protein ACERNI_15605 [Camelimonas sp. ID_303_24]